ncbi:hypothetical protein BGX23_001996, partial [Mortierella sp. AD031]
MAGFLDTGLALDGTVESSLTPSPGFTSSDIICPILNQGDRCSQHGPTKNHGVNISEYCRPHGHYISLIVSYPAEIASYFMDKPAMKHADDFTEIDLISFRRSIFRHLG